MSGERPILTAMAHYHRWANVTLLDFCLDLDPAALHKTGPGGYGTILGTLEHLTETEHHYLWIYRGRQGEPPVVEGEGLSLDTLRRMLNSSGEEFLDIIDSPDGPEWVEVRGRGRERRVPVGVFFSQILHHAAEHRTNVTSALTHLELEPPELSPWVQFLDSRD